jgi:TetR/AcrR family transcriptional repressor of mexJK operon
MAKRKGTAAAPTTKREAILEAALEVFLESGYAAANMDVLAARAGVSKATIYAYFKGKDELFGELIRGRCESCFGPIVAPEVQVQDEAAVKAALRQLALNFWAMVTTPEALGAYRIVVAEAPRFPEVGQAFYQTGPAKGLEALRGFFADLDHRGLLAVPNARLAAEFFVGLLRSDLYLKRLLGLDDGGRSVEAMVDAAVELLYRAYAPPAKG